MKLNGTDEALDCFAFVEVMGHSRIAGRLTTRKLGVQVMLQVDVLKAADGTTAYTKLYSPSSIFSITPVNEDYCRKWSAQAARYDFKPVPYVHGEESAQVQRLLSDPPRGVEYEPSEDDDE